MKLKYIFFLLLFVFTVFNLYAFFLSHETGDEVIYTALAYKIDKFGLIDVFKENQYTLCNLRMYGFPDLYEFKSSDTKIDQLILSYGYHNNWESDILNERPPLFPITVSLLHKIKNIFSANTFQILRKDFLANLWFCHFETVGVVFIFSIFSMLILYRLAAHFVKDEFRLVPLLLLSATPIWIISINKVWTESMLFFFVCLSVFYFTKFIEKEKPIHIFLGGFFSGLAALTKISGLFTGIFFWVGYVVYKLYTKTYRNDVKQFLLNNMFCFLGIAISWGWWFLLFVNVYNPIAPFMERAVNADLQTVNKFYILYMFRPWYFYLTATVIHAPIYLFFYGFVTKQILRREKITKEQFFLIFYVALYFILLMLRTGKDYRYALVAYPSIVIFSTIAIQNIFDFIKKEKMKKFIWGLILVALCFQWVYGLRLALFYKASYLIDFMDKRRMNKIITETIRPNKRVLIDTPQSK